MEAKQVYLSFPISKLAECSDNIPFTVYIRLQNTKYIAIFSTETGIDRLRLLRYSKHVQEVFIKAEDKEVFENFTQSTISLIEKKASDNDIGEQKNEIVDALQNATSTHLEKLLMPKAISSEEIEESKKIVKTYIRVLARNPDFAFQILNKINESQYLCYHSLATSMLSIFICRLTKQYGTRLLEIVGLGGFLHDIGKARILEGVTVSGYEDILAFDNSMKEHPKIGFDMLKDNKAVSEEVKQIVFQHHEFQNGQGYPLGVNGARIYYPASLITVANTFANYIGRKPFGLELTPRDAIRKMLDQTGCYNKPIIKILTQLYKV